MVPTGLPENGLQVQEMIELDLIEAENEDQE